MNDKDGPETYAVDATEPLSARISRRSLLTCNVKHGKCHGQRRNRNSDDEKMRGKENVEIHLEIVMHKLGSSIATKNN
jgi:hypothetical protein